MCLLVVCHRVVSAAPILVAANREEQYARPATPPQILPGPPRILCGIDQLAGGTWLGINENGLVVAVTNRAQGRVPPGPRSRGVLCRDMLACRSVRDAAVLARHELATGRYAGANYVCADPTNAAVIYGGDRIEALDLQPGIYLMTNGDLNDVDDARLAAARRLIGSMPPQSIGELVDVARRVCSHPEIIVRSADRGTVSSSIIALALHSEESVYLHASGAPDQHEYDDYSTSIRRLMARRSESQRCDGK